MIIAMHGDPGAGKDTVGEYLVEYHGFTRMAFADRLKLMCEDLDPIVAMRIDVKQRRVEGESSTTFYEETRIIRLTEVIAELGWDEAKKCYPEVRRTQQRLATEVIRARVDPDYWTKHIEGCIAVIDDFKDPDDPTKVVITDLRFPNEAALVKRLGGEVWWITRENNPYGGLGENANHVSEQWHPEVYVPIANDGEIEDLHVQIEMALRGDFEVLPP